MELAWISEAGSQAGVPAPVAARSKSRERLAWIVAAVAVAALLTSLPAAIAYFRQAPVEVAALRFSVLPPEKASFGSFVISPDGRRLAFAATVEGKTMLWVRPMDSLTAQALPGTEGADFPFWSPDNRWIGFFAGGKLKKIEASGGSLTTLCDAADGRGGAWNREGVILFTPVPRDRLYRVLASGGTPTPVTTVGFSRQETSHRWPCFLPDDRHFIYATQGTQDEILGIYLGSLDGGETKRLFDADSNAIYAPPGYWLFMRGQKLLAQPFDASRLQVTAEPFAIEEQVGSSNLGALDFSASDNGVLVYRSSAVRTTQLAWYDRVGNLLGLVGPPADYWTLALSPDEKRVAVVRVDPPTGTPDIWVSELVSGRSSRLTFDPATDADPVWSPDGTRIVFDSNRAGPYDLYQKLASGAGNEEVLLKSSEPKYSTDWSRDGRFIAYVVNDPKNRADIWVLQLEGPRQSILFLQTKFQERGARFSPDGRWIAYTSNESGRYEVYVKSFPPSGGKWQISTGGGRLTKWRRDGRELFYVSGDNQLMAAEVKPGATFEFGVPKPLLEARVGSSISFYDVTGDGQRFLINSPVAEAAATPVTVVLNWTAELKK